MIDLCAFLEKVVGDKSCIWIFNIDAEKIWFSEDITVSQDNFDFITGMESINLLVCRKQDYVILRKFPNQDVLNHLQQHGVNIFNIIVPQIYDTQKSISECILQDDEILNLLRKNKDTYVLFPYAVTYLEEEISVKTGIKVIGAKEKIARLINDKIFSRNLANKLNFNVCAGDIFDNVNDAFAYYKKYFGNKKVILKKSHGASGKGLYIIEDEKQFECIIRKAKYFKLQNECILEKFYDNKIDINYQIAISKEGETTLFSLKQQTVNVTKYVGSIDPPQLNDEIINAFKIYSSEIGKELYKKGYWGIASIDAMIENEKIIPIVEINGRMSLSTYTSFICSELNFKQSISVYYDVFLSSDKRKFILNEIIDLIENNNDSNWKTIMYSCSIDSLINLNNKYKCRIFLIHLGDTYDLLMEKKNYFELKIKMLIQ